MRIIPVILLCLARGAGALETGAEFLKIDTDARAVSMGSAYTAAAAGVNAISYNAAGLTSMTGVELAFSHTNWLMDSKHDFLGFGMPLGSKGPARRGKEWTMGLGITRLTNSGFEGRNEDRSAGGDFSAGDQSISIGAARVIGKYRAGVAAKYIESSIAGARAHALAADLGLTRALGRWPVDFGLTVQNIGTPMRYISQKDRLPLTVSAGFLVNIVSGFSVALDVRRLVYDRQTALSIGTEYGVLSGFSLRSGYLTNSGSLSSGNRDSKGFSAGAGVNFMKMQADYSFTPFGALGDAQKITLRKKF